MESLSVESINLLRQNARSVVRELGLLNDAYFEIGITLAERHLLIELLSLPSPTMGEIAERLLLDKSTVSRLIAKAMKKGYVKSSSDEKDKRKRFLHLTELGKKTLHAFEPIAFHQTKEALQTLNPEEIEMVYRGIALYAKGLRNSRLQNKLSPLPQETPQPIQGNLVEVHGEFAQLGLTLHPVREEDEPFLYEIFREVVDEGFFPYECSSLQEFYKQFLTPLSHVYVCRTAAQEVVGGFYVRANFSGRCSHMANAAYMIKREQRGRGIGSLFIKASLEIAKNLGFQSMRFNMVLSQNERAIKLYEKWGFQKVGTLPQAIRNRDGSYQDGHIMHRSLL